MIIKPRVRGFICVTTHPAGCEANVRQQIGYVKAKGPIADGPKRVLVIGASTGYGLAARITAAFGCGAGTLGSSSSGPAAKASPARPAGTTRPPSTAPPRKRASTPRASTATVFPTT